MMFNRKSAMLTVLIAGVVLAAACTPTRTRETVGETIDDKTITAKVKEELIESPATKARQIDVIVRRGEVQLGGFVDSADAKAEAARIAAKVRGVQTVHNDLIVRDQPESVGAV